jgi:hypothetical protein
MALCFFRYAVASNKTYFMSLLVDLWIILFYLGNIEYHLVAINFNYVQADFFDIFSYCYPYKNSLILYYSFILFYYRPINNIK